MNVGFLDASMLPEDGGGYTLSEDVLVALRDCEGESRHQFRIYAQRSPAAVKSKSALRGALTAGSTRPVPVWVRRLTTNSLLRVQQTLSTRQWERRLAQDRIDVLWSAMPMVPTFEVPFIVPVWDLEHRLQPFFPEVSARGEWKRRQDLFSTMLRRAAYVITGTEIGRDQIIFLFQVPASRIRILPHPTPSFAVTAGPVDVERILNEHGIPQPYLLFPAQFWAHKNHVGVLHGLKEARARTGLPLHAVFCGDDRGNSAHVRTTARALEIEDCVHFLGFVGKEALIALYRGAFALTYLSFFGVENLPPLEAFALGCPVIAAEVPGAREQLADAAILVDPANPAALAEAIAVLASNPQRRAELIALGLERAKQFTASDYVRGVFKLLDEFEPVRQSWPSVL